MFWNEYSGGSAVLGGHLDRENFTLADLLEHDDILQECRSQNKKLVDFLLDRNTIKELISLIINEPTNIDDPSTCYRHPALACEIITSGVPGLIEKMTSDDELLCELFSFLNGEPPLNPLLASFFSKTFQVLLNRQYGQDWYSYQLKCLRVLEFSKNCPSFITKLLEHLGTSAIMDTVQCIMHVDLEEMKKDFIIWLDSQKFIEKLISIVCGKSDSPSSVLDNPETSSQPETSENKEAINANSESDKVNNSISENVQNNLEQTPSLSNIATKKIIDKRVLADRSENAAKLLCDLILKGRDSNDDCTSSKSDPLSKTCALPSTVDFLLSSMFSSPLEIRDNAIINGIQVLLALLNDAPGMIKPPSVDHEEIQRYAEAILPYFPKFKEIIAQSPTPFKFGYSNSIEKPVGAVRLAAIHLLEVLLHLDSYAIATTLVQYEIMPLLIDMFVEYKWNNFLHAYVVTMIRKMFEAAEYKDIYSKHIFFDCKILEKIIFAWEENDKLQAAQKPRCGYMGHLIQIANYVQDYLVTFPDILENVPEKTKDEWNSLANDKLDAINTVQNAYLGGKHPSQANSSDQMIHQGYDNMKVQIHEISYGDDDDNEDLAKQLTNSEQLFAFMCKNRSNSLSDEQISGELDNNWDNFGSKLSTEEDNNFQGDNMPKNLDETTLYGLATKLSSCDTLNHDFEEWLSNKYCNWGNSDDSENATGNTSEPKLFLNSSPWETNDPLSNSQTEWADFTSFANPGAMSEFPNQFNCDYFAGFDDLKCVPIPSNEADSDSHGEDIGKENHKPTEDANEVSNSINSSDDSQITNNAVNINCNIIKNSSDQPSESKANEELEQDALPIPDILQPAISPSKVSPNVSVDDESSLCKLVESISFAAKPKESLATDQSEKTSNVNESVENSVASLNDNNDKNETIAAKEIKTG